MRKPVLGKKEKHEIQGIGRGVRKWLGFSRKRHITKECLLGGGAGWRGALWIKGEEGKCKTPAPFGRPHQRKGRFPGPGAQNRSIRC